MKLQASIDNLDLYVAFNIFTALSYFTYYYLFLVFFRLSY